MHQIDFQTILQAFEVLWNEYVQTGRHLRQICGPESIEALIRQLETSVRRLHIVRNFLYFDKPNGQRQFRNDPKVWPFLLHTCSWSSVSDSRDKVYGALGLLSPIPLEPDYEMDVREAYTYSTFNIIKRMGSLALFTQVVSKVSLENGLPSWVPGWRKPTTTTAPFLAFFDLFRAGGREQLDVQLIDADTLRVNGARIDEVEEIAMEYDHRGSTQAADLPSFLNAVMTSWMQLANLPPLSRQSFTTQFTQPVLNNAPMKKLSPSVLLQQSAYPVQQSQSAPFYRDAGYLTRDQFYSRRNFAKASPHNSLDYWSSPKKASTSADVRVVDSFNMPMQSARAPLYTDADHRTSRDPGAVRYIGNDRPSAYRTYDSFSHTCVDARATSASSSLKATNIAANDCGLRYLTGETSSEVFWRTLCMDVIDCDRLKRHRRCSKEDSHRLWEWLDWICGLHKPSGIPQLHWHLNTHLQNKRMIKTKCGYIGLASKDTLKADQICIFASESYPYVLRKIDSTRDQATFNLVSPAYVHGWMDGRIPHLRGRAIDFDLLAIA